MRHLIGYPLVFASALVFAAQPTPAAKQEVAHLLDFVTRSGCQFNRNGSWHEPAQAAEHLSQKYEYLLKRGLVVSAEDFIARAASESSMTGKPYLVRCSSGAPLHSAAWLQTELARYRAQRNPQGS